MDYLKLKMAVEDLLRFLNEREKLNQIATSYTASGYAIPFNIKTIPDLDQSINSDLKRIRKIEEEENND